MEPRGHADNEAMGSGLCFLSRVVGLWFSALAGMTSDKADWVLLIS